nr:MAG TPA: hypothetical protein [Caudoviricetes sp.]
MNLAKQAAAYITKLNGEAETFEIESNGITAVIAYDTEIVEDKGDYWTAPSWSIEDETVAVEAVYDEDGEEDKEAADWLKKMLNKQKKNRDMKFRKPAPKISKARAIELVMNLNGVSRDIAEKYTNSELREVLRLLKLKANF